MQQQRFSISFLKTTEHLFNIPCVAFYAIHRYARCTIRQRTRQQKADDITLETVEYIKNQPLIKAIFCGHLHDFVSETHLTDSIVQYVSNFDNVRLVEIV